MGTDGRTDGGGFGDICVWAPHFLHIRAPSTRDEREGRTRDTGSTGIWTGPETVRKKYQNSEGETDQLGNARIGGTGWEGSDWDGQLRFTGPEAWPQWWDDTGSWSFFAIPNRNTCFRRQSCLSRRTETDKAGGGAIKSGRTDTGTDSESYSGGNRPIPDMCYFLFLIK